MIDLRPLSPGSSPQRGEESFVRAEGAPLEREAA